MRKTKGTSSEMGRRIDACVEKGGLNNFKYLTITIREIKNGKWNVSPAEGQRKFLKSSMSSAVESLLGRSLPDILANIEGGNNLHIIDGQQRIYSILEYVKDGFRLKAREFDGGILDEEIIKDCDKKFFTDLEEDIQDKILDTKICVKCYQNLSPEMVKIVYLAHNRSNHLSTIEKTKAKYDSHVWEEIEKFSRTSVCESIRIDKIRYEKEKMVLSLLAIHLGLVKGTRFNDVILNMKDTLESMSIKEFRATMKSFENELSLFNTHFGDLIYVKCQENKGQLKYRLFSHKVLFSLFHCICIDENMCVKEDAVEKIRNATKITYSKLFEQKQKFSYGSMCGDGSDAVCKYNSARNLILENI